MTLQLQVSARFCSVWEWREGMLLFHSADGVMLSTELWGTSDAYWRKHHRGRSACHCCVGHAQCFTSTLPPRRRLCCITRLIRHSVDAKRWHFGSKANTFYISVGQMRSHYLQIDVMLGYMVFPRLSVIKAVWGGGHFGLHWNVQWKRGAGEWMKIKPLP